MAYEELLRKMRARNFLVQLCQTQAEAKAAVLGIIGQKSVGIGGSNTVKTLGLYETLKEQGNAVYCHTYVPGPEKERMRQLANAADVYLCSANAVTADGRIVNIDGTGNRVSGTIYGPKTVILVVGRNKLSTTLDEAIERIKRETCPRNSRRLGYKTPCSLTDTCGDCRSEERMCNVTAIIEWPTRVVEAFHVILIDEDIGW